MEIEKTSFKLTDTGIDIPAIRISSPDSRGSVLVMHGYGGNKEEQLGLGFRIAECGFDAYAIDLRGHGENPRPLGVAILDDVNAIVGLLSANSRQVVTVGHSLGGRVSLLCAARFRVGISPAVSRSYSEQTRQVIRMMRRYRAREEKPDAIFDLMRDLPAIDRSLTENDLILYGSRDVHEIVQVCERLKAEFPDNVKLISDGLHSDVFVLEETFTEIGRYLRGIAV